MSDFDGGAGGYDWTRLDAIIDELRELRLAVSRSRTESPFVDRNEFARRMRSSPGEFDGMVERGLIGPVPGHVGGHPLWLRNEVDTWFETRGRDGGLMSADEWRFAWADIQQGEPGDERAEVGGWERDEDDSWGDDFEG